MVLSIVFNQQQQTTTHFIKKTDSYNMNSTYPQIIKELVEAGRYVACENIRFSSLFADGDVSRGGTSATQWQKFHTDDVKSVQNPVRSVDWSME